MPTKRHPINRRADSVPPGILGFLLGEPFDPLADNRGRLEVYRHSREELLEKYWPMLTPAQRRKASRVR